MSDAAKSPARKGVVRELMGYLERETGIEPATFSLGS
jgi:hypothetical protein